MLNIVAITQKNTREITKNKPFSLNILVIINLKKEILVEKNIVARENKTIYGINIAGIISHIFPFFTGIHLTRKYCKYYIRTCISFQDKKHFTF
jgi:hypothetical protein